MTRPVSHQHIREDLGAPRLAGLYGPLLWLMGWVASFIAGRGHVQASAGEYVPNAGRPYSNRQVRRARASCLRRVRRCARKGRRLNPADYMPRAYAHFELAKTVPADIKLGRFMALYARESGLGRACVFGLSATQCITAYVGELARTISVSVLGGTRAALSAATSAAAPLDAVPP